jgi:hypothetical protein
MVKAFGFQRRPPICLDRAEFRNPHIPGPVLYRCYGLDGTLLYIGQTGNLHQRIQHHRYQSVWWFAVERIVVQRYRSRVVLLQDERQAITVEQPYFNRRRAALREDALRFGGRRAIPLWSASSTLGQVIDE